MFCRRISILAAASALAGYALAGSALADPTPVSTTVIGPFTGHDAPMHPDNLAPQRLMYYGTDLGFTYVHDGKIQFIFGDTNADESGTPIQAPTAGLYDDTSGSVDLGKYSDPALFSATNMPLIKILQNPGTTEVGALDPGVPIEQFKTPIGGFSNGAREFGMFYTYKPTACRADADCTGGFTCDTGLGWYGNRHDDPKGITFTCPRGAPGCNMDPMLDLQSAPLKGSGFCSDKTSSIWADTAVGRTAAVGVKNLIGIRSTSDPRKYAPTRAWSTNKFSNATLQTVQDFVPGRARHDYRNATKATGDRRVFLWGRPGFLGINARNRTLGLYFAYVDMPRDENFKWEPRFFTGIDAQGVPKFSTLEKDAVALDLDSSQPGSQPVEPVDLVNQQSIVWVEHLKKWVMFFGGGIVQVPLPPALVNCGLIELFVGAECKDVVVGDGSMRMRTADNPWGPWSPAKVLIAGGDPKRIPLEGQYAPGGVLYHPSCNQPGCTMRTDAPQLPSADYGFLYAANIIEPWIKPVGKSVDIIWNVSTWDPYRVVLLRTRIDP